MQVCCLPRSLWSTSSQELLPRVLAAAPAAAAAVLTARQVLPHRGAHPVQSPPQAGPSEGQDPASHPTLLSGVEEVDAQNLPHLTEPTSNTIWPDAESLDMSACLGSNQVLLYSGDREVGGAGQGSVVQSGIVLEDWAGFAFGSFLRGSQAPPIVGTVYRQSVSQHRAGGPPYPFPFNLFSFS